MFENFKQTGTTWLVTRADWVRNESSSQETACFEDFLRNVT